MSMSDMVMGRCEFDEYGGLPRTYRMGMKIRDGDMKNGSACTWWWVWK